MAPEPDRHPCYDDPGGCAYWVCAEVGTLFVRALLPDPWSGDRIDRIEMALSVLAAGAVHIDRYGGTWETRVRPYDESRWDESNNLAERWLARARAWRLQEFRDGGASDSACMREITRLDREARTALTGITGGVEDPELRRAFDLLARAVIDLEDRGRRERTDFSPGGLLAQMWLGLEHMYAIGMEELEASEREAEPRAGGLID